MTENSGGDNAWKVMGNSWKFEYINQFSNSSTFWVASHMYIKSGFDTNSCKNIFM